MDQESKRVIDPKTKHLLALQQIKNITELLNGTHVFSVRLDSSGKAERVITITYQDLPTEGE